MFAACFKKEIEKSFTFPISACGKEGIDDGDLTKKTRKKYVGNNNRKQQKMSKSSWYMGYFWRKTFFFGFIWPETDLIFIYPPYF